MYSITSSREASSAPAMNPTPQQHEVTGHALNKISFLLYQLNCAIKKNLLVRLF